MDFRDYVTCGNKVICFIHGEGAVLGDKKKAERKKNLLGASS